MRSQKERKLLFYQKNQTTPIGLHIIKALPY